MRLMLTTVFLLFLMACSNDSPGVKNKVLPPERLKAIVGQGKAGAAAAGNDTAADQHRSVIRSRRHKKKGTQTVTVVTVTTYRQVDTLRMRNLKALEASGIRPDMSEPINQSLILCHDTGTVFSSAITLSSDRVLKIGFDNDIFDYTDQFYTNGIRFDYVAPALSDNPVKHILLPYWGKAKNYYGLSLVQNLYTPSTTKKGGILYGDRPYSAYLYFGSFKITNDPDHHYRQSSELDLGVIGPPSMGGTVQDLFHKYVPYNNEPLGWEYQICTDAVVNYNFSMEKGVVNTGNLQFILAGTGSLGTLYTNITGGFTMRLGWFNDYFSDLGIRKRRVLKAGGERVNQYFFTVRGLAKLVAYDATLQGGMFNNNSVYTIPASAISNFVVQSGLGFTMTFGAIGVEIEQIVLSPEFGNNWWHAWGHVGLFFAL